MSTFERTKSRGASNRLLGRDKPNDFFGGPDSIEITPYFETNYGDFLDDEAQFMAETSAREEATVSAFEPFGGNADTRLAQIFKIYMMKDRVLWFLNTLENL